MRIQLPNKNIISRAINHLFPFEIFSVINADGEFSLGDNSSNMTHVDDDVRPSSRKAAAQTRERILEQLVSFFLPPGVSRRNEHGQFM